MSAFAVLHIPHSATAIPPDLRDSLRLTDEELERELLLMTDWYTDEIFALSDADFVTVRFPVSRLVVDPERFLDDAKEVMSNRGMGVVYLRASNGALLRDPPTPAERADLINRFYAPHHAALSDAVNSALEHHGHCLVVDCHSFPSQPLPCELDQSPDRPQVCLGIDKFHTPDWLIDLAQDLFRAAGLEVAIDRPFSGALVPLKHLGRHVSVLAIMVELNRGLYMNELSGARLTGFPMVVSTVQNILQRLVHACRSRSVG
jgi:N-formylglutamate amidohydrolase